MSGKQQILGIILYLVMSSPRYSEGITTGKMTSSSTTDVSTSGQRTTISKQTSSLSLPSSMSSPTSDVSSTLSPTTTTTPTGFPTVPPSNLSATTVFAPTTTITKQTTISRLVSIISTSLTENSTSDQTTTTTKHTTSIKLTSTVSSRTTDTSTPGRTTTTTSQTTSPSLSSTTSSTRTNVSTPGRTTTTTYQTTSPSLSSTISSTRTVVSTPGRTTTTTRQTTSTRFPSTTLSSSTDTSTQGPTPTTTRQTTSTSLPSTISPPATYNSTPGPTTTSTEQTTSTSLPSTISSSTTDTSTPSRITTTTRQTTSTSLPTTISPRTTDTSTKSSTSTTTEQTTSSSLPLTISSSTTDTSTQGRITTTTRQTTSTSLPTTISPRTTDTSTKSSTSTTTEQTTSSSLPLTTSSSSTDTSTLGPTPTTSKQKISTGLSSTISSPRTDVSSPGRTTTTTKQTTSTSLPTTISLPATDASTLGQTTTTTQQTTSTSLPTTLSSPATYASTPVQTTTTTQQTTSTSLPTTISPPATDTSTPGRTTTSTEQTTSTSLPPTFSSPTTDTSTHGLTLTTIDQTTSTSIPTTISSSTTDTSTSGRTTTSTEETTSTSLPSNTSSPKLNTSTTSPSTNISISTTSVGPSSSRSPTSPSSTTEKSTTNTRTPTWSFTVTSPIKSSIRSTTSIGPTSTTSGGVEDTLELRTDNCAAQGKHFRMSLIAPNIKWLKWGRQSNSTALTFDFYIHPPDLNDDGCGSSLPASGDEFSNYGLHCDASEHTYTLVILNTTTRDIGSTWYVWADFTDGTSLNTSTTLNECTDCGLPDAPENGHAQHNSTKVNSTVIYHCNKGYNLVGESETTCSDNGTWVDPAPVCNITDCGFPPNIQNGAFTLVGGTTYSAIAIYSCLDRYKLSGHNNRRICNENGVWIGIVDTCLPVVCKGLRKPQNGGIEYSPDNNTATFSCDAGYSLNGKDKLFCQLNGIWSGQEPQCIKVVQDIPDCPEDTDQHGTLWNVTKPGVTISISCQKPREDGSISRSCILNGNWKRPVYTCVKKEISEAETKISAIESTNVTDEVKIAAVSDVLDTLSNSTQASDDSQDTPLYDGEIEKVTSILEKVASISQDIPVSEKQSEDFIGTTSSLLDVKNADSYKSLDQEKAGQTNSSVAGAGKVLEVVGAFTKAIANSLDNFNGSKTIKSPNLVVTVETINEENDIRFPNVQDLSTNSSAEISATLLKGNGSYSGIYYNNLSKLLPPTIYGKGTVHNESFEIATSVIDMQLIGIPIDETTFDITLHFHHSIAGVYNRKCSFWNYSRNSWDTSGCQENEQKSNDSFTVCNCNHLTNFAILMNPYNTGQCRYKSTGLYLYNWLQYLCGLSGHYFGCAYTAVEIVCTIIAVALHYIYLVVFCLMLAEGIEILITVVYVFVMKSRRRWLLTLSWGLPVIIVGVAVGITKTEGYGSETFCWLSVSDGLIWAFVGPALIVILINFVILTIVMKTMFSAKTLKEKALAEKVKTGVRCLCVLLPLTGGTWVIGVFYVNERLEWIQYLFAIINSLQGLAILICHCVMNSQVRIAISRRWRRYRAYTTMSSQSRNTPLSIPRPTKTRWMYNDLYESTTDSQNDSREYDNQIATSYQRNWTSSDDRRVNYRNTTQV